MLLGTYLMSYPWTDNIGFKHNLVLIGPLRPLFLYFLHFWPWWSACLLSIPTNRAWILLKSAAFILQTLWDLSMYPLWDIRECIKFKFYFFVKISNFSSKSYVTFLRSSASATVADFFPWKGIQFFVQKGSWIASSKVWSVFTINSHLIRRIHFPFFRPLQIRQSAISDDISFKAAKTTSDRYLLMSHDSTSEYLASWVDKP